MPELDREQEREIDDRVRADGGNATDDETVPCEEMDKAIANAQRRNTKEVPGS
jgi:hypothetical protein